MPLEAELAKHTTRITLASFLPDFDGRDETATVLHGLFVVMTTWIHCLFVHPPPTTLTHSAPSPI